MTRIPQKPPTDNGLSVPLIRSPRTLRHLPIATLVRLTIAAVNYGEHVAGARVDDLRSELRRRECEGVW